MSSLCHWPAIPALVLLLSVFTTSTDAAGATTPLGNLKPMVLDAPLLTSKIATNRTILVDITGKEEFTSVQKAIDSVPEGNKEWVIIHVRKGTYREKVVIPESKPFIFLRGNGKGRTHIVWNQSADDNVASATFSALASKFVAFGISFRNDAPIGEANTPNNQSVAAMVAGDMSAFYHCAFYSPHNTLFDRTGRHYYDNCYIQGSIDFIFGRGQSLFQECEIFVVSDRRKPVTGSIVAQNREEADDAGGFVFVGGKVYGVRDVYLGRPKGEFSRVVFVKTYISKTIMPEGWTTWSYDGSTQNVLCGEFDCRGPGADQSKRVSWARKLKEQDVKDLTSIKFINGDEWLPAFNEIN